MLVIKKLDNSYRLWGSGPLGLDISIPSVGVQTSFDTIPTWAEGLDPSHQHNNIVPFSEAEGV